MRWVQPLSSHLLLQPQDIEAILADPNSAAHHTVPVDIMQLANAELELADALLKHPAYVLKLFHAALFVVQNQLLLQHAQPLSLVAKEKLHVRLHSPPYALDARCFESSPGIRDLRTRHIGRLVSVVGTVVKAHQVKILLQKKVYECSKCQHRCVDA